MFFPHLEGIPETGFPLFCSGTGRAQIAHCMLVAFRSVLDWFKMLLKRPRIALTPVKQMSKLLLAHSYEELKTSIAGPAIDRTFFLRFSRPLASHAPFVSF